jgi:hypothetical protein
MHYRDPGPAKPDPVYYRNMIENPLSLALLGENRRIPLLQLLECWVTRGPPWSSRFADVSGKLISAMLLNSASGTYWPFGLGIQIIILVPRKYVQEAWFGEDFRGRYSGNQTLS